MGAVAVVNPIAGGGTAPSLWSQVAANLGCNDIETIVATNADHATAVAHRAAHAGQRVIAVGGDGLVRDVAAGVVAGSSSRSPSTLGEMAIVPAGRGNDLATRIGLPVAPVEIAAMLERGATRAIDVLDVNSSTVPGNVYVGVDAVAARYINRWRRLPSWAVYRAAGVAAVTRWKPTEFTLAYTDPTGRLVVRIVNAHDIVIANSGQYGHGLNIVPSAELDDGLMDVMVVDHGPRRRIVTFLLAAQRGHHVDRDDVTVFRARTLSIKADRDVPFGADGDEVTTLPAHIAVRPHALRVVVGS